MVRDGPDGTAGGRNLAPAGLNESIFISGDVETRVLDAQLYQPADKLKQFSLIACRSKLSQVRGESGNYALFVAQLHVT